MDKLYYVECLFPGRGNMELHPIKESAKHEGCSS